MPVFYLARELRGPHVALRLPLTLLLLLLVLVELSVAHSYQSSVGLGVHGQEADG